NERAAFDVRVDDHQVLVQDWRSGTAINVFALADAGLPERLAVQVEGENPGHAEKNVDLFAVGDRRAGRVPVQPQLGVVVLLGLDRVHVAFPEKFTALAIHADQVTLQVSPVARVFARKAVAAVTGQKNPVADHDGGGSTRTRQLGFPDEVAVVAPGNGQ